MKKILIMFIFLFSITIGAWATQGVSLDVVSVNSPEIVTGENGYVEFTIENIGDKIGENLYAELTVTNPLKIIGKKEIYLDSIDPTSTDKKVFRFNLSTDLTSTPGTYYVSLLLKYKYETKSYQEVSTFPVEIAGITNLGVQISDITPNNPTPGTGVLLALDVINTGNYQARNVLGNLDSTDPFVRVLGSGKVFGTIGQYQSSQQVFEIEVAKGASVGNKDLTLTISYINDKGQTIRLVKKLDFELSEQKNALSLDFVNSNPVKIFQEEQILAHYELNNLLNDEITNVQINITSSPNIEVFWTDVQKTITKISSKQKSVVPINFETKKLATNNEWIEFEILYTTQGEEYREVIRKQVPIIIKPDFNIKVIDSSGIIGENDIPIKIELSQNNYDLIEDVTLKFVASYPFVVDSSERFVGDLTRDDKKITEFGIDTSTKGEIGEYPISIVVEYWLGNDLLESQILVPLKAVDSNNNTNLYLLVLFIIILVSVIFAFKKKSKLKIKDGKDKKSKEH